MPSENKTPPMPASVHSWVALEASRFLSEGELCGVGVGIFSGCPKSTCVPQFISSSFNTSPLRLRRDRLVVAFDGGAVFGGGFASGGFGEVVGHFLREVAPVAVHEDGDLTEDAVFEFG